LKLQAEHHWKQGRAKEAVEALKQLSVLLENEIVKPHQYHAQANQVKLFKNK